MFRSILSGVVAVYSERTGNTFGPKGFSIGSSRHISSSKYPQVELHEGDDPGGGQGDLAWVFIKGLVRVLVVVLLDRRIETRQLLECVRRGGFGRFSLERQVHPLVSAVLLGMPGPMRSR